jgi:hypothetical protein
VNLDVVKLIKRDQTRVQRVKRFDSIHNAQVTPQQLFQIKRKLIEEDRLSTFSIDNIDHQDEQLEGLLVLLLPLQVALLAKRLDI